MTNWKEYKLGKLIETVSKTFKFSDKKVVFLNTSDTLEGKVINHTLFEPKKLPGQAKKTIQPNDILYSEIRPANKRYAFVDFDSSNYVVSTKLMVLRVLDKEVISPKYLYYFLTSDEIVSYLQMLAESRSGTFPQIRFEEVSLLDIKLPPLKVQNEIVELVASLDDKIELNNKINQELENLAQTLFKQWFIDFEFPTENGEPYKSSGGEMVDSELGQIPKGWEVGNLNKIASLIKKSIKPFENPESIYNHYSLPEFDSGKMPSKELGETILSSKYEVFEHSILISKLNPRIPRIWTIINPGDNSICSTEFQVLKPIQNNAFAFVNCLCSSDFYLKTIQSKVTGTSSSHQRVNPKDIIDFKMVMPPSSMFVAFNNAVYDTLTLIDNNRKENTYLTNLRDTLLPKLISGELEVSELVAEKA